MKYNNVITPQKALVKDICILLLFGFLVLSPLSSKITIDYLHLPLALPEMLFFPFFPFFKFHYKFPSILNSKFNFIIILLWCVFVVIGILNFTPFAVISTSRAWLYISLFYCVFRQKEVIPYFDLFMISLGSIIGWLMVSVINFQQIISIGETTVTYGPMLAVEITIVYCVVKNKRWLLIPLLILCVAIGFLSALRRELAVVILSLLSAFFLLSVLKPKLFFKYITILATVSLIIGLNYETIASNIQESSGYIYQRVIVKTEQLIEGDNSSDASRASLIIEHISTIYEDFLPKGYIDKQYMNGGNDANGDYNDVPLMELTTTYGALLAVILIGYFSMATIRVFILIYKRLSSKENIIIVCGGILMVALLFLEGSYFTFAYCAPYTGYMLGTIQHKSKLKLILRKS